MAYTLNAGEKVTFTYKNDVGAAADPTDVYAKVTEPDGTEHTYHYGVDAQLVRDSLGVFHVNVRFTSTGHWTVDGWSTGTIIAAVTHSFLVGLDSLATLDDFRSRLTSALDVADEDRAEALLIDASAAFRRESGQQISQSTSTARIKVINGLVRLPQRPVTDVASITDMNGNDVAFTWYAGETIEVAPNVPDSWAWVPWRNGITHVDVTYTHGYEQIPADVIAVVCQMAARAFGRSPEDSGMTSETVAGYSYSVGAAAAAGAVGMLPDERLIASGYGRPAGVSRLQ